MKSNVVYLYKCNVVYLYKCCCEQRYAGKTPQVLAERIKQHVPSKLSAEALVRVGANDSAVTKHLKESPACIPQVPASRFEVLANARSRSHLDWAFWKPFLFACYHHLFANKKHTHEHYILFDTFHVGYA